jgi:ribonuclease P protein component
VVALSSAVAALKAANVYPPDPNAGPQQPECPQAECSYGRAARVTKAGEYRHIFKTGRRSSDKLFTVVVASRPASAAARLGLAVGKRAANRAIDRNRLKRLTRESFRMHRVSLPSVDIVVLAKPAARQASSGAILAALSTHWLRIVANAQPLTPSSKPIQATRIS